MRLSRSHLMFALGSLLTSLLIVPVVVQRNASAQPAGGGRATTVFFMDACPHDGAVHISEYVCPDTINRFEGLDMSMAFLTVRLANGRTYVQQLPRGTDAVFLSNTALEKFLVPYYVRVRDTRKVAALRAFISGLAAPRSPAPAATKP